MEEKNFSEKILLFCEDYGSKNFITLDPTKDKGDTITFRCHDCDYLNTVLRPDPASKKS